MPFEPPAAPAAPCGLTGHAFTKYPDGERMLAPVELPTIRAEMWHHPARVQNDLLLECNEAAVLEA